MAARDRLGDWPGGTRPTDGVVPSGDRCVTNIVMMGMGEPLYNFEAVRDALLVVADGEGLSDFQTPHYAFDLRRGAEY